eukprot:g14971.t1
MRARLVLRFCGVPIRMQNLFPRTTGNQDDNRKPICDLKDIRLPLLALSRLQDLSLTLAYSHNKKSVFCPKLELSHAVSRFSKLTVLLSAAVGTALHCHAGTQECSLCRDGRSLPVADGGGVVGQNASRRHLPSHQAPLQMRGLQLGVCCAGIPRRRNAASLVKGQRVSREDI